MKPAALLASVLAAALSLAPGLRAAELILNGGFESPALAANVNYSQILPASWSSIFPGGLVRNEPSWYLHAFYPATGADGGQYANFQYGFGSALSQDFTVPAGARVASVTWSDAVHGTGAMVNYLARLVRASDSTVLSELAVNEIHLTVAWHSRSLALPEADIGPGRYRLEFAPNISSVNPSFFDAVSVQSEPLPPPAAHSTIDRAFPRAHAANAGWIDFRPSLATGVVVSAHRLAGHAHAANFGWIDLGSDQRVSGNHYANTGASDFGVNLAPDGTLSGLAHSANAGWITFSWAAPTDPDRPRLDLATGLFHGLAHSANLGWINLGAAGLRHHTGDFPDLDADGLPDNLEIARFGTLATAGPATDADADGVSDLVEYRAGTDLQVATSLPPAVGATPQAITFSQPADLVYDSPAVALDASADSGLPVVVEKVSGPGILSLDTSGPAPVWRFVATGVGPVVLRAHQPGDATRAAAPDVVRTFNVARAPQTISFPAPQTPPVLGGAPTTLSAHPSSHLPAILAIVSGPATLADATLRLVAAGDVVVRATQPGNEFFAPATPVERTFSVASAPVATVALATTTVTYDGTPHALVATVEPTHLHVTYAYRLATAPIASATANPPRAAGVYTVVATVADPRAANAPSATATLTIAPKSLSVTSPDVSRLAGQANPAFPVVYSGFVPGEDASVLVRAPVATCRATPASPAGDYPITISGGAANNYSFGFFPGNLTVRDYASSYETLLFSPDAPGLPMAKLVFDIARGSRITGKITAADHFGARALRGDLTPAPASPDAAYTTTVLISPPDKPAYDATLLVRINAQSRALSATLNRGQTVIAQAATVAPLPSRHKNHLAETNTLVLFPPLRTQSGQGNGPPTPIPLGAGYASVAQNTFGDLKFTGLLGDGTSWTATLPRDAAGRCHLFVQPYSKRAPAHLAGLLAPVAHPDLARRFHIPARGQSLYWIKSPLPAGTLKPEATHRAGFGPLTVPLALDPWIYTRPNTLPGLLSLAFNEAFLVRYTEPAPLFGPSLAGNPRLAPASLSLDDKARLLLVSPAGNPRKAKLGFAKATGVLQITQTLDFTAPGGPTDRRGLTIRAIFRQVPSTDAAAPSLAHGHFTLAPSVKGDETATGEARFDYTPQPANP